MDPTQFFFAQSSNVDTTTLRTMILISVNHDDRTQLKLCFFFGGGGGGGGRGVVGPIGVNSENIKKISTKSFDNLFGFSKTKVFKSCFAFYLAFPEHWIRLLPHKFKV